jgi:hypothetical protein
MMAFNPHIAAGIVLLATTILFLAAKLFRAPKRGAFCWWGWLGLALLAGLELLLALRTPWVVTYFTPLAWTSYLLLADALVGWLRGESLLADRPREFLSLVFWSVPLWLIFEAYNLRLENWAYVGLPGNLPLRGVGYVWSFATIWPAIFETADLIAALGIFARAPDRPRTETKNSTLALLIVAGMVCVVVPVIVPQSLGRYLFGAVWLGFILLLDPLNCRWNGFSFLSRFGEGQSREFWSFVAAGWTCGILWEFWNYWAAAKWIYIFPIGQSSKVFEMPLLGYLGFLPFALECKVMYEFVRTVRKQLAPERRSEPWEAAHPHGSG